MTPNPVIEPELVERIARNRDTLRYFLNWEYRPRTQIGTLYRTFSRYDGEDCSVTSKDRLEQLYADTEKAADAITALQDKIRRLEEALAPSGDTKAAYHGEFSFLIDEQVGDAVCEVTRKITVPWTTIKEIMAAIRERALNGSPDQ